MSGSIVPIIVIPLGVTAALTASMAFAGEMTGVMDMVILVVSAAETAASAATSNSGCGKRSDLHVVVDVSVVVDCKVT